MQNIGNPFDKTGENNFHIFADLIPNILWIVDSSGNLLFCNNKLYEYIGNKTEKINIIKLSDYVHPDDLEKNTDKWNNSIKSGNPFEIEYRLKNKFGNYRWFVCNFNPLPDTTGNIVKWLTICTDIQVHKEREEKLNSIFNDAPAFISIFQGPEHIFEFANPQNKKLFGLRDVEGKPIREALKELEGQGFFEFLDNVYNTGQPFIGNEVLGKFDKTGNGDFQEVYFNFVYKPYFNERNEIEGIYSFAFDVTELVQSRKKLELITEKLIESEAKYKELAESLEIKIYERTQELIRANKEIEIQRNRLESLFMNAPAMISLVYGPQHVFSFINPLYEKFIGKRDIIGKTLIEAFPELENQGAIKLVDNVYKTGKAVFGKELETFLDAEGTGNYQKVYFNFVYQPLFDIDNNVEGIGTFAFDVTEQVIARRRVEEIATRLLKSNEQLQQFAYIASHDLQEPLRTVVSYIQLLQSRMKEDITEEQKDFIKLIIDSTKRMQSLINDLLSYSKIGSKQNEFKEVNLNNIMDTVISNLENTIENSKAKINYQNMPVIKAVSGQMVQLFQNLISNGIKYHKKDFTPIIDIDVSKENGKWIFSVKDNGIGINSQYFSKIFLIFQRLHGRNEYEGTGIGLATCKKIVEIHGGEIWVESEEGTGTTFFFSLSENPTDYSHF